MLDIRPDVHILESLRAMRVDYPVLVGEAADNAFDAQAQTLMITFANDRITFQDDGIGITKGRTTSILRLGEHGAMTSTALGRYGVGIKHHAVCAGDVLEVDSTSSDGTMSMRVDWTKLIKSGGWLIEDANWVDQLPGAHTGSRISIRYLKRPPTPAIIEKVRSELAQRFYPAIASGRRIIVDGKDIPLLPEPKLTDIIETELSFPGGRTAKVRGGMLVDRNSRLRQVQVSYRHRVILPMSDFGCDSYNGTGAMFARVDLNGPWRLGTFKNELEDEYTEPLSEAVCEVLEPILERCHSESMSADIEEITRQLNEMLPPDLVPVRPKRRKPRKPPAPPGPPRPGPGIDDKGDDDETGPARAKRSPRDTIEIEFDRYAAVDECGYGRVSFGQGKDPSRIKLTASNPHIAELRALRDRSLALRGLFSIALMLYEHARETDLGQRDFFDGVFGLRVWKMVDRQKLMEAAE